MLLSIIPFFIYYTYDFIKFNGTIPNNPSIAEFLVFIIILVYFFFEKMKVNVQFPIYQTIDFWICVGLFIYFTGSFFFLLLISNVNKSDNELRSQMAIIYSIVTIVKNIMLSASLFVNESKLDQDNPLKIPSELNLDSFSPKNNLN